MVTVFRAQGFRIVIYVDDHEPAHVHVIGDGEARIDIIRVIALSNTGMTKRDLARALGSCRKTKHYCSRSGRNFMAEFILTDEAYEEATRRGKEERASSPLPSTVRFDAPSGRIVVEFANGAAFMIPARSLQGLEDASDEELAEVELLGGTGLHWETRNVDFRIQGLMAGIFGTARFMDAMQRGGQSRSPAKIAASRANGAKGGRPRKSSSPAA